MASHAPILASPRVAPLASSSLTSASLNQTFRSAAATDPTISDLWGPASKMQILVVRNSLACVVAAVFVNGCFYAGNIFSFKPSTEQSPREFLMAMLVWTMLSYAVILVVAHLPTLMSQRFLKYPDYKPSVWFCMRKLLKMSTPYFVASMGECGYYACGEEDILHRDASRTQSPPRSKERFQTSCFEIINAASSVSSSSELPLSELLARISREFALCHHSSVRRVCALRVFLQNSAPRHYGDHRVHGSGDCYQVDAARACQVLQELVRFYIIKKGVRSIRTTVLIDTQARIVLLGTQTSPFLLKYVCDLPKLR
ncbi:hypothetical protein PHYSODRAFT_301311 [Phytophthora sojae]|uniref:Uncharacterized protein n=1 Tax=Phytophthora sojae (strain P6497) TaxID=1094619 RepID=G4ZIZ4_PHYSP|nr:hypothetical protein PHYSODRAFT_301311 [Phytophthora sojae]EGZ18799.1 hypothetical protein PHYSODRAFT_301311 [Phytophthora sojae]|eukprot:XP_009527857.1 hypothetical protein PHYSODRAFT_301311 [Phytophthora sojae]